MNDDEPDWQKTVAEIGPKLYRYFSGSFPSAIASDLVQESLLRLVQKYRAGEFKSQQGTLSAYVFGIARYVRLEALKTHSTFATVSDEGLEVAAEGSVEQSDRLRDLRRAIGKLKPIEQEIILLMIDTDSQLDQIAHILKMPVGTVKSHVHRAKENLRQIMEVHA